MKTPWTLAFAGMTDDFAHSGASFEKYLSNYLFSRENKRQRSWYGDSQLLFS